MVQMDDTDPPGINAFQGVGEKEGGHHTSDLGTWVTEDPDVANYFAGDIQYGGSPTVYPLQLKMDNPIEYDTYEELEEAFYDFGGDTSEFTNELINRGYDGIQITNSTTDVMYYDGRYVGPRTDYVVFDGRQLRSPFAGFDPKKADSRRILTSSLVYVYLRIFSSVTVLSIGKSDKGNSVISVLIIVVTL